MSKNIVHQYFKKETDGTKLLLKFKPIHRKGTQLTIRAHAEPEANELDFDGEPEELEEVLRAEGYVPVSAIEYNLYLSGLL
ncbi:MAG: hypothetical protein MUC38_10805 [Cyclobacteriaceae bacterium]|nr:hypothetical protein [Cyclobacteriaceae bacterium]